MMPHCPHAQSREFIHNVAHGSRDLRVMVEVLPVAGSA
jgi:hypothetical protein